MENRDDSIRSADVGVLQADLSAHRSLLFTIIGMLGVMLSLFVYSTSRQAETERYEQAFRLYAQMHGDRIQARIDQSLELLNAFASLMQVQPELSRDDFRRFSAPLFERHPEISSMQWAPRVSSAQRSQLEARLQRAGLAPLGIFDVNASAETATPATRRDEYFPVFYAEPLGSNHTAIGLDTLARPYTRTSVREAAYQGEILSTALFPLVQDPKGPLATAIYLPVYHPAALNTPDQRWQALRGFTVMILQPAVLVDQVWGDESGRQISLELRDVTNSVPTEICPRPDLELAGGPVRSDADGPLTMRVNLALPGRQLELSFVPAAALVDRHRTPLPVSLMLATLVLTGLAIWLVDRGLRRAGALSDASGRLQERKKILDALALSDPLTGLPNWACLEKKLAMARYSQRYAKTLCALYVIDLDDFDEVNRQYGRTAGDTVLSTVGERLQAQMWVDDLVARVGNDEFVAFLPGRTCAHDIHQQLRRVQESLCAAIPVGQASEVSLTASIGVVLFELDDTDLRPLCDLAEQALLEARSQGDGRYAVHLAPGTSPL